MSRHFFIHMHLSQKRKITLMDKTILVAAFAYPLSGLPQVFEVFRGHSDGVSLSSWVAFTAFGLLFLAYSVMHKIKPMIVSNILWLILDLLVVVGILMNRMMP